MPLNLDSQDITLFFSRFGWFIFLKLPSGVISAPDHYKKCMKEMSVNQSNVPVHMNVLSSEVKV